MAVCSFCARDAVSILGFREYVCEAECMYARDHSKKKMHIRFLHLNVYALISLSLFYTLCGGAGFAFRYFYGFCG